MCFIKLNVFTLLADDSAGMATTEADGQDTQASSDLSKSSKPFPQLPAVAASFTNSNLLSSGSTSAQLPSLAKPQSGIQTQPPSVPKYPTISPLSSTSATFSNMPQPPPPIGRTSPMTASNNCSLSAAPPHVLPTLPTAPPPPLPLLGPSGVLPSSAPLAGASSLHPSPTPSPHGSSQPGSLPPSRPASQSSALLLPSSATSYSAPHQHQPPSTFSPAAPQAPSTFSPAAPQPPSTFSPEAPQPPSNITPTLPQATSTFTPLNTVLPPSTMPVPSISPRMVTPTYDPAAPSPVNLLPPLSQNVGLRAAPPPSQSLEGVTSAWSPPVYGKLHIYFD